MVYVAFSEIFSPFPQIGKAMEYLLAITMSGSSVLGIPMSHIVWFLLHCSASLYSGLVTHEYLVMDSKLCLTRKDIRDLEVIIQRRIPGRNYPVFKCPNN